MADTPTEQKRVLENILTISARDYCEMHGKNLSDYTCIGIHENGRTITNNKTIKCGLFHDDVEVTFNTGISRFLKTIPKEAEVVVDYRPSDCMLSGTALIPKKQ